MFRLAGARIALCASALVLPAVSAATAGATRTDGCDRITVTPATGKVWRIRDEAPERLAVIASGASHYFWQIGSGAAPPGMHFSTPPPDAPPPPPGKPTENGIAAQSFVGTPTKSGSYPVGLNIYPWPNYPDPLNCPAGAEVQYTVVVVSTEKLHRARVDAKQATQALVKAEQADGATQRLLLERAERFLTRLYSDVRALQVDDPTSPDLIKAEHDVYEAGKYLDAFIQSRTQVRRDPFRRRALDPASEAELTVFSYDNSLG